MGLQRETAGRGAMAVYTQVCVFNFRSQESCSKSYGDNFRHDTGADIL